MPYLLAAAFCLLIYAALSWHASHRTRAAARSLHADVAAHAHAIIDLTAHPPHLSQGPLPRHQLLDALTTSLARVGLPSSMLAQLTPQPDAPRAEALALAPLPTALHRALAHRPAPRLVRQSATLQLTQLTLPDLGRWLEHWHHAHPEWTIAALEFAPLSSMPHANPALRVSITLETSYLDIPSTSPLPFPPFAPHPTDPS